MPTLVIIVFGGLAIAYALSSIGEMLIRRGALELDRATMDRVWAREIRGQIFWKTGETIAVIVMLAGLFKLYSRIFQGTGHWGIPAVAIGFALFCVASVIRAWICRAAYAAEAPGSKASRGAFMAGMLTTLAECAVGIAVCAYIFTHIVSSSPASTASNGSNTSTSVTGANPPRVVNIWVTEAAALEQLPGKNAAYLKALSKRGDVRFRTKEGVEQYYIDDIKKQKDAGLPSLEELGLDQKPGPATEPVEESK